MHAAVSNVLLNYAFIFSFEVTFYESVDLLMKSFVTVYLICMEKMERTLWMCWSEGCQMIKLWNQMSDRAAVDVLFKLIPIYCQLHFLWLCQKDSEVKISTWRVLFSTVKRCGPQILKSSCILRWTLLWVWPFLNPFVQREEWSDPRFNVTTGQNKIIILLQLWRGRDIHQLCCFFAYTYNFAVFSESPMNVYHVLTLDFKEDVPLYDFITASFLCTSFLERAHMSHRAIELLLTNNIEAPVLISEWSSAEPTRVYITFNNAIKLFMGKKITWKNVNLTTVKICVVCSVQI